MSVRSSRDAGAPLTIADQFGKGEADTATYLFTSLKCVLVDVATTSCLSPSHPVASLPLCRQSGREGTWIAAQLYSVAELFTAIISFFLPLNERWKICKRIFLSS